MAAIGRRSVQEQNQETQSQIRTIASRFRSEPLRFLWLIDILKSKRLSPERGILVSLRNVPDQGGTLNNGVWLTDQHRFIEFSVLLPHSGGEPELESWVDTTTETIVKAHQPGTGKSFGLLALEVLSETIER